MKVREVYDPRVLSLFEKRFDNTEPAVIEADDSFIVRFGTKVSPYENWGIFDVCPKSAEQH